MVGERLGKGLKGSELFKKTENIETNKEKSVKAQIHISTIEKNPIGPTVPEVRKHFVLPGDLAERLRLFCFSKREKEARAVRKALEMYLQKEGF